MQITEKDLIEIINEEIDHMIENDEVDEGVLDRLKAQGAGALSSVAGKAAGKLGFSGAAADAAAASAAKKAASLVNSYAQHILKLKSKLEADGSKLGIQDDPKFNDITKQLDQLNRKAVSLARNPPQPAGTPAATTPAPAAPAATPAAAAEPAASPAATPAAAPAAAEPAAAPAAAEPAAAEPAAAEPAAAEPAAAEPAATAPATPQIDDRLQAWVDGGKGELPDGTSHRTITNRARLTQKDGKTVFNSGPALALAQQFVQQFPDRASTPMKQAIQNTIDSGAVGVAESAPISEEAHQQFLNEIDEWERQLESKGKETLEEQLQNISKRWGFIK